MKKTLLTVALIVLLIGAIAPHFVGKKVEQNITDIVQKISESAGYVAKIQSIETNWFNTTAKVEISLTPALFNNDDEVAEFFNTPAVFNVLVNHGPFIFAKNGGLAWSSYTVEVESEQLREHLTWQPNSSLYQIQGQTSLFGTNNFSDTVLPFTATIELDNSQLEFKGYQGKGSFSDTSFSHQSTTSEFSAKSEKGTLSVSAITTDISAQATFAQILKGGIYDSSTKFAIGNINFVDVNNQENIAIDSLAMKIDSNILQQENVANILFSYAVNKMKIEEHTVNDALIAFELNRLDVNSFAAFDEFNQLVASVEPSQLADTAKQYINEHLLPVLMASPEFNMPTLKATMSQGKFSGSFSSKLVGVTQVPEPLVDPAFWLGHLIANAQFEGDKTVVEWLATQNMVSQLKANPQTEGMTTDEINQIAEQQIQQLMQSLQQQGLLVATETTYSTKAVLKDKALLVNDKAIPLGI